MFIEKNIAEVCDDGDVRILKQDGFSLVEICHDGVYLPVCHEEWDTFDATVVCRQSGYDECKCQQSHYIIL